MSETMRFILIVIVNSKYIKYDHILSNMIDNKELKKIIPKGSTREFILVPKGD